MKIKEIHLKNFRAFKDQTLSLRDTSILIGNNGTGKTSLLEAVNFALSAYNVGSRFKHTDFRDGGTEPAAVDVLFDTPFFADLPDGYQKQRIECHGVHLEIKNREKASPGKALSDLVVASHFVVPTQPRDGKSGWKIRRKSGSDFEFDQRLLSMGQVELTGFPRSFYFGKNRDRQLQKGYNSSISAVMEDFNWRFIKSMRPDGAVETFLTTQKQFRDEIIDKVDEAALKKTFHALNERLARFGINKVDLSFVDGRAPFDAAFLTQAVGNLDMPVTHGGSGHEMIVSLLFLETLASLSKEGVIILIDEPELHLHPQLQTKLIRYLVELSKEGQVILSTHSPYFFSGCTSNPRIELLVSKRKGDEVIIENTGTDFGLFQWSPSWGEINFLAYDLPTNEFHNELYGYLQQISRKWHCKDFDDYLVSAGHERSHSWDRTDGRKEQVTLMTYIRHTIHHPENTLNATFTEDDLRQSTLALVALVRSVGRANHGPDE